ncbi:AAA family ATPase [Undibacterium arcticum]
MSNVARRLLEAVMSFKRPDKAGRLQQQIDDIEGFDDAKKARIIRFTHSYSHHSMVAEPEHDHSILAEGPEILEDVLRLIKHVDAGHFDRMAGICGRSMDEATE